MESQATLSPARRWSFPSLAPGASSQGHALELPRTVLPHNPSLQLSPPGPKPSTTAVLFLARPLLLSGGSLNTPCPFQTAGQALLYPAKAKAHPLSSPTTALGPMPLRPPPSPPKVAPTKLQPTGPVLKCGNPESTTRGPSADAHTAGGLGASTLQALPAALVPHTPIPTLQACSLP